MFLDPGYTSVVPTWKPQDVSPDALFDGSNINFFFNNLSANASPYFEVGTWKNQTTIVGNTNAISPAQGNYAYLRRQEVGGSNSLYFDGTSLYYKLIKYNEINFDVNQAFYIAFTIRTLYSGTYWIIDSRNSSTFITGLSVILNSGKIRLNFYGANGNVMVVDLATAINDGLSHSIVIQNSGAGNASGVTFYLDGVSSAKTVVADPVVNTISSLSNYYHIGTTTNLVAGTYFKGDLGVVMMSRGTLSTNNILSFHTYYIRQNRWAGTKSASNPVINGSTVDTTQSYPPFVWKEGSSWYAMCASGGLAIIGYTSSDGVSWTESGTVLANGGLGTWDADYVTGPMVRKVGSTYYLFYQGYNATTDQFSCGYAISSSALSGYTKFGSNPFYTPALYNASLSRNMDGTILADVVVFGGVYYWFFNAFDAARSEAFYATSNALTTAPSNPRILFKGVDGDPQRNLIQEPVVHKESWGWVMAYTEAANANIYQERNIRSAYCLLTNPTAFTLVDEDVVNCGEYNSWESLRVYGARFLKDITDGQYYNLTTVSSKYRFYYSGHSLPSSTAVNTGKTGLIEFDYIPILIGSRSPLGISFNANASVLALNGIAWADTNDNCYYDQNSLVWQINNKYQKNNPLISVSGRAPTLVTNTINSLPISRFNGVVYYSYGKALGNTGSYTQFIVVRSDLIADYYICGCNGPTDINATKYGTIKIMSTGKIRAMFGDNANYCSDETTAVQVTANTFLIIAVTYTSGNTFSRIYKNGTAVSTTSISAATNNTGSVVGNFSVGRGGDYTNAVLVGDIAEFLMFGSVLSDIDFLTVNSYLSSKYNIS